MNALKKHRHLCAAIVILGVVLFAVTVPFMAHADIPQPPSTCGLTNFSFNECIWYPLAAGVSSVLISVSAWFLAVASTLFNWLVEHTIIQFGANGEIYDKIKTGVEAGWTALRDVANIIIIGMFTFISISIILGNKEYGQKRLIANVLIIAVLINFSLLFTKLIVDASNYTATQFYASIAPTAAQQASAGTLGINPTEQGYSRVGVAGAFINFLGVTSIGDSYDALKKLAASSNSGWIALAHGLFAFTVLGGAAFVLFYGSFLLVSRAVLIIFLMVVSAGAFATYLIPKLSDSASYGWHAWWKSLLRAAVLAPLLMIFLWVTLKIAAELKTKTGTLGHLLSAQAGGDDFGALFAYLIILGLLFASFKLASVFSAKIGGFSFTGTALGTAAFAPVALGSRLVAPLMRWRMGGAAMKESAGLEKDIHGRSLDLAQMPRKTEEDKAAYSKAFDELAAKMKRKEKVDTRAKRSYNLMNAAPVKAAAAGIGVPSFLAGADAKPHGYADTAKARATEAAKKAEGLAISEKKAREDVRERRNETDTIERKRLRDEREAARELLRAARATADARRGDELPRHEQRRDEARENVVTVTNDANQKKVQIENQFGPTIRQINDRIADPNTSGTDRGSLNIQKRAVEEQRRIAIEEQDNKIKGAQSNVRAIQNEIQTLEKSIKEPVTIAEEALKTTEKAITNFERKVTKEVNEAAEAIAAGSAKTAEDMAARIAHRRLTNLPLRMLGTVGDTFNLPIYRIENDAMAMKARETLKKSVKTKVIKERLTAMKDLGKELDEGEEKKAEPPAAGH